MRATHSVKMNWLVGCPRCKSVYRVWQRQTPDKRVCSDFLCGRYRKPLLIAGPWPNSTSLPFNSFFSVAQEVR